MERNQLYKNELKLVGNAKQLFSAPNITKYINEVREAIQPLFFANDTNLLDEFIQIIPVDSLSKVNSFLYDARFFNVISSTTIRGRNVWNTSDALAILEKIEGCLKEAIEECCTECQLTFFDNFLRACTRMQSRKMLYNASEDDRNDEIREHLLEHYFVADQSRYGCSSTGKGAGHPDLVVNDNQKLPIAIVEGMNLDTYDATYIDEHVDKIFDYDGPGNKFNVIAIYTRTEDLDKLVSKYKKHLLDHNFNYKCDTIDDVESGYASIKILKSNHIRNNAKTELYHYFVQFQKSKVESDVE